MFDILTTPTGNMSVIGERFSEGNEELRKEYDKIRCIEPLLSKDIASLSEYMNVDFSGVEYSVKTAKNIEDKLQRTKSAIVNTTGQVASQLDLRDTMLKFKDIIRYTEICAHVDIFTKAHDTIGFLEEKGYVLSQVKNYYVQPTEQGYKGLHLWFISPYGQEFEMQVHSKESFQAKQDAHILYEQVRSVATSVDMKNQLTEKMQRIFDEIPNPSNYDSVPYNWTLWNKTEKIEELRERISVNFQTLQKENGKPIVSVYSVIRDGKTELYGLEHVYSDGSARTYQNFIQDNFAKYSAIDKNGVNIITKKANQMVMNLDRAAELADIAETETEKWLIENTSVDDIAFLQDLLQQSNSVDIDAIGQRQNSACTQEGEIVH